MNCNKNSKPPFKGFTEIFRRVALHDIKEDSQAANEAEYDPPCSVARQKFNPSTKFHQDQEQYNELPAALPASPSVNIPLKYDEWFHNRIKNVVIRCQKLYGPIYNETGKGAEKEVRRLLYKMQHFNSDDSSTTDESCQCIDCQRFENKDEQMPLNKHFNVHEYPQKYEFDLLNKRLNKIITDTSDMAWFYEFYADIRDDIYYDESLDQKWTCDRFAAEREELTKYVNDEMLKLLSNKKINFKPETFTDWSAKFSFNSDKKFKHLSDEMSTHLNEDFYCWLKRTKDTLNHKQNIGLSLKKQETANCFNGRKGNETFKGSSQVSINSYKPSVSRCSSSLPYNRI